MHGNFKTEDNCIGIFIHLSIGCETYNYISYIPSEVAVPI